jgi:4-amino-4-deoxy-L-arabinose transferase-like glycosyltransferase
MTTTLIDTTASEERATASTSVASTATRLSRLWPEASVVLASLVVNLWGLSRNGLGNTYYAAAVRSMTQSWSNFFYGAFDPGGWITVDKPPAALWLQAASAKLFGFSSWSLLAPQAVCGAVAVALLLVTVRRVWGRWPGLAAAAALALMPVSVAVARSNNPDMVLVLCAVAAAFALERAIATDRLRWLATIGLFVGLGFLSKLLVIGVIVPAFGLAYLLASKRSIVKRLLGLAVTSAVALAVCGVWIAAADLPSLSSRPYIGGSTNGSALDLVFGYNGIGRVTGNGAGPGGGRGGFGGSGGIDQFGGTPGLARLFNNGMGDQVMWLAPIAAVALLAGIYALARRRRLDARVGSLVAFGGWAITAYVVFAFAGGIFHNYYVSLLAPAVAALAGIGVALVMEGGRLARFVAGGTLAVTAWLQLHLMQRVDALTWLRPLVGAGTVALALGFVVAGILYRRPDADPEVSPRRHPVWLALVGATAVVVLAAPAAWSLSALGKTASGTFPDARPGATASNGPGGGPGGGGGAGFGGGGAGDGDGGAGDGDGRAGGFVGGGELSESMLTWLRSQQTTERWLVAVSSSMQASQAIIDGDSVMAVGGFSGSDNSMSKERLAELVAAGELRFVMGGSGGIAAVVAEACTAVPATTWGGSSGSGTLYDCSGKADAILASTATVQAGRGPGTGGFPGAGGAPGAGAGGPGVGGVFGTGGFPGSGTPGAVPAGASPGQAP